MLFEETRPSTWDELTEAEKREARERGFPRSTPDRRIIYKVKRRYPDNVWKLTGWYVEPHSAKPIAS